ncbi:Tautomerase/MIF superfamily [Dactylonectria estremocensis]|uniref:L-dopachrome isomerase n=1 Tax=Dactylonectria estremocensis TaxID=1079267 RepID=A0A9P9FDW9_9HYPO|nr:Tautomerase/MIF superfamily [Dactylonectria estremocensis]
MEDSPVSRKPLPRAPGTVMTAETDPLPPAAPPEPALPEQRGKSRMNKPSLEPVMEGSQKILGDIIPLLPGDAPRVIRKQSHPELRKQRSLYFEDLFASKEKDLLGDMVYDESTFVKELSRHLAVRYHRQMSSIVVTLRHSACIFFGGCCGPAYVMTIEALSSLIQPATNKRNVALLQQHMDQALAVPASRGYVRFVAMPEECSGWQGKTVAGKIAEVGGQAQVRTEKSSRKPKTSRHGSLNDKSTSPKEQPSIAHGPAPHAGDSLRDAQPENGSGSDTGPKIIQGEANAPKTLRRRKSFIQTLLTKTSSLVQEIQGARARRGS